MTPFGPQLIGETEKTLNALLRRSLAGTGLSEPEWVSLRLADLLGGADRPALVAEIADRAHVADAGPMVDQLAERGLLDGGMLTAAGRDVVDAVQSAIVAMTMPVWHDLDSGDVVAAERVLHEVLRRGRLVLAAQR